ncbi:hypothetical protein GOBAR_AA10261 [Gossypium barbadense]|uniref:Zinc finger PMZ-type domain-containing protein n=1 Tax=Gossypium barbadense TaxID=3634 RepID=A0A2P5Y451_GOSBA|nr:hypothetical protein GOBAR_AA10261 [Gossypium barbadense]
MLVVACLQFDGDGNESGEGGKGGEVVGNKCGEGEGEGGKVAGSKYGEGVEGQGVGEGGEDAEGLGGEGVDVTISEGGEKGVKDESDNDSEDKNVFFMKVMYLSDGDDDEELQEARQKVREVEGKTSGKGKETVLDETKSEHSGKQFEAKIPKEVNGEGLNDSTSREEDENETEYCDNDDHGSILGSEDDDNTDVYRRRSRFPTYNPNLASPHFCIGMLFKDGEQFKSAIPTIGDHPKMKLREIQRKAASEMHVNVNMTRCKRAKKMSTTENEWKQNKKDLYKLDEGVAKELFSKNSKAWTKAFQGCRSWQLSWILCPHVCCAIWHLEQDPNDYLHRYYHNDTYLKAYEYVLQPINGSHEWNKPSIKLVLVLDEKAMPDRPKKNRRKAKNEPKKLKRRPLNRDGLIMRYRKCGGEGHNKGSCIQPNTIGAQSSTSTRTRSPKSNNITPCIQPNTTGS